MTPDPPAQAALPSSTSRADLLIKSQLREIHLVRDDNLRLVAASEAWRCESRKWRRRAFFWFAVAWLETVAVIVWAVTR